MSKANNPSDADVQDAELNADASASHPFTKPGMCWVPAGEFTMGATDFYPEEAPLHKVALDGFWMDSRAVTNAEFAAFVAESGYQSVAERAPNPEDYPGIDPALLLAGSVVFSKPPGRVSHQDYRAWWRYQPGACWHAPTGPGSSTYGLEQHPVVHVAYEDALAYARWAGKDLPTEAEWEYAARGGLERATYVWGDEPRPEGKVMANTWQGEFPWENLLEDGFEGTAPVGSFPPNGYGLFDMAGNVWQWTCDYFMPHHPADPTKACCTPKNPRVESKAQSFDPAQPHILIPRRVIKGGSHLCAPNYCLRYRPAARQGEMEDSSTSHIGFRCVVREA